LQWIDRMACGMRIHREARPVLYFDRDRCLEGIHRTEPGRERLKLKDVIRRAIERLFSESVGRINELAMRFRNRQHAAQLLIERLRTAYQNKSPLVLGVPRGAVPMAKLIADALGGELDVVLVHKLSHPEQPELAIGAIDEIGNAFVTEWAADVDPRYLEAEKKHQLDLLRRRRARYTPFRAPLDPAGRIVIVVDDGVATGSTMTAALRAIRAKHPKTLVGAVAVASQGAARAMLGECDDLVCLAVPTDFYAVGQFFDDFTQVTDEDVVEMLRQEKSQLWTPE
jgi:putative phosphoribosyl transferase